MKGEPTTSGIWLQRARDQLGLSRTDLANAAGISSGTLRNAEIGRHRISRQTARRLMAEIAERDVRLARTAPSPLKEAAPPQARGADSDSEPQAPAPPPLAHLRFRPFGPHHALLQVEIDPHTVRQLVRAIGDLLTRSELFPGADLPELHLVLVERK